MQSVHLFMLCPTVTHETSFDLSNLKAKILNCIGVFLKNLTLCPGVANWRGAQFAAPIFSKLARGLICPMVFGYGKMLSEEFLKGYLSAVYGRV